MSSHMTGTAFPFRFGRRSRSIRRAEYIGNAPKAVREEIEVRAQIIDQMSYAELHAGAARECVRWLRERLRTPTRSPTAVEEDPKAP